MEDAESELRRRRERGRSSQAAFRKRQAKAIEDTKDENRRLKEALRSIVKITRANDRPELVSVVREGAETAGIDVEHLNLSESGSGSNQESNLETPASKDGFNSESGQLQSRAPSQKPRSTSRDEIDLFVKRTRLGTASSGAWMNPFHYMPITNPPEDIIPYLGDARYTLAGQMFWTVLEQGQAVFHRRHHANPTDLVDPLYQQMMNHSKPMTSVPPAALKVMVDARLEYRNFGYITSQHATGINVDTAMILHKLVVEDYLSRGKDPNLWLTPLAVEWRVRAILGDTLFAMLEKASRSPETSVAHQSVKGVVAKLVNTYVCFGDGPRWAVGVVDEVISEWTVSPPVADFDKVSFFRKEWRSEGGEEFFVGGAMTVPVEILESIMGTTSAVQRWRVAQPDPAGTERYVIKRMTREIKRLLHEAGVEEGKEVIKGRVDGVLFIVKKRHSREEATLI